MPRGAKDRRALDFRRSYSSEDEPEPRVPENLDLQLTTRTGPRLWWSVGLSVLGSAVAMAAAGCVCALTYPILKGMRVSVRVSAHVTGWVKFTHVQFQGTYLHFRRKYCSFNGLHLCNNVRHA